MKKVSFLIINYNDSKTTIKLLNQIKDYKNINNILVVDNNSSDDSIEQLKKITNKKIEVIKADKNGGYGYGINFGLKKLSDSDYVIISNPDIIIENEKDLTRLIEDFNNNVAMIGPTIIENNQLNRGWKIPSPFYDGLCNLPLIGRFFYQKLKYSDKHYQNKITEVEAVSGCFFIVDNKIMKEINYFDENIFLYYEENIIAKKLAKIDKKIVVDNRMKIIHNHSVSIDKSINKLRKLRELKKSQFYFQKNYNNANIFSRIWLIITAKMTIGLMYLRCLIRGGNK